MLPQQVFAAYDYCATESAVPFAYCPRCGTAWTALAVAGEAPRCATCGYRVFRNPTPAVSVLVTQGLRFVLCRRRLGAFQGGRWCLPSGYIEFGEDFLTAGRREVLEETGLAVRITAILSVVSNFFRPDLHSLVIVLLAEPVSVDGALRGGDDIDLARWFDNPAALPPMAFEADTHIVQRYYQTRVAGAPVDPTFASALNDR